MFLGLDEASIEGTGVEAVTSVLETLQRLLASNMYQRPVKWSRIYEVVCGELRVGDWLWNPDLMSHDVRLSIGLALDRCPNWDDGFDDDEGAWLVQLDGTECIAPTVSYVHRAAETIPACLAVPATRPTPTATVVCLGTSREMWFIEDEATRLTALRKQLEGLSDPDAFLLHAAEAFPNLLFASDLPTQLRRFSRPVAQMMPEIVRHLGALNDHAAAVFDGNPDPDTVARRMAALAGVTMSPESPNTRANARAWRQREITYDGRRIRCAWHMKIEPTIDRIHFHPGRPDLGGKPIVGIFAKHLDT